MFLGIPDPSVSAVYLLTILATVGCVVYGLRMWDKEGDLSAEELAEETRWAEAERELEKDLGRGEDA